MNRISRTRCKHGSKPAFLLLLCKIILKRAQSYMTETRGVWALIFSPKEGWRWPDFGKPSRSLWRAAQKPLPRQSPGGWELGQEERPKGEKWSRDWLESLCPLLDHKPSNQGSSNWASLQREQEGCRDWGEGGYKPGWGSWDQARSSAGTRRLGASWPRQAASPSPGCCLEPRPGPSAHSLRSALKMVLFYFIILHDWLLQYSPPRVVFQMQGHPESFSNLCVYTVLKEVTQWKVFLRLFSDQMGHRLSKKHPNLWKGLWLKSFKSSHSHLLWSFFSLFFLF